MRRRFPLPRFLALWLTLCLSLPSPAYALRTPNAVEAGLEEDIAKALGRSDVSSITPATGGLEEGWRTLGVDALTTALGSPAKQALKQASRVQITVYQKGNVEQQVLEGKSASLWGEDEQHVGFSDIILYDEQGKVKGRYGLENPDVPISVMVPADTAILINPQQAIREIILGFLKGSSLAERSQTSEGGETVTAYLLGVNLPGWLRGWAYSFLGRGDPRQLITVESGIVTRHKKGDPDFQMGFWKGGKLTYHKQRIPILSFYEQTIWRTGSHYWGASRPPSAPYASVSPLINLRAEAILTDTQKTEREAIWKTIFSQLAASGLEEIGEVDIGQYEELFEANEVTIYKAKQPDSAGIVWWLKKFKVLWVRDDHVTEYVGWIHRLQQRLEQRGVKEFRIVETHLVRDQQGQLYLQVPYVAGKSLWEVVEGLRSLASKEPGADAEYKRLWDGANSLVETAMNWINQETGGLADIHSSRGQPDFESTLQNLQVPEEYLNADGSPKAEAYGRIVPVVIDALSMPRLQEQMAEKAIRAKLPQELSPAQSFLLRLVEKYALFPRLEQRLLEENRGILPEDPRAIFSRLGVILATEHVGEMRQEVLDFDLQGRELVAKEMDRYGERALETISVLLPAKVDLGTAVLDNKGLLELFLEAAGLEERGVKSKRGNDEKLVDQLKRMVRDQQVRDLGSGFLGDPGITDGPLFLRFDHGRPSEHWVRMGKEETRKGLQTKWVLHVHRSYDDDGGYEGPGMWLEILQGNEGRIPRVGRIWAEHTSATPPALVDLAVDLDDLHLDKRERTIIRHRADAFVRKNEKEILDGLKQVRGKPPAIQEAFLTGTTPGWERVYAQVVIGSGTIGRYSQERRGNDGVMVEVSFKEASGLEETAAEFVRTRYAPLGTWDEQRLSQIHRVLDQFATLEFSKEYSPVARKVLQEVIAWEMLRLDYLPGPEDKITFRKFSAEPLDPFQQLLIGGVLGTLVGQTDFSAFHRPSIFFPDQLMAQIQGDLPAKVYEEMGFFPAFREESQHAVQALWRNRIYRLTGAQQEGINQLNLKPPPAWPVLSYYPAPFLRRILSESAAHLAEELFGISEDREQYKLGSTGFVDPFVSRPSISSAQTDAHNSATILDEIVREKINRWSRSPGEKAILVRRFEQFFLLSEPEHKTPLQERTVRLWQEIHSETLREATRIMFEEGFQPEEYIRAVKSVLVQLKELDRQLSTKEGLKLDLSESSFLQKIEQAITPWEKEQEVPAASAVQTQQTVLIAIKSFLIYASGALNRKSALRAFVEELHGLDSRQAFYDALRSKVNETLQHVRQVNPKDRSTQSLLEDLSRAISKEVKPAAGLEEEEGIQKVLGKRAIGAGMQLQPSEQSLLGEEKVADESWDAGQAEIPTPVEELRTVWVFGEVAERVGNVSDWVKLLYPNLKIKKFVGTATEVREMVEILSKQPGIDSPSVIVAGARGQLSPGMLDLTDHLGKLGWPMESVDSLGDSEAIRAAANALRGDAHRGGVRGRRKGQLDALRVGSIIIPDPARPTYRWLVTGVQREKGGFGVYGFSYEDRFVVYPGWEKDVSRRPILTVHEFRQIYPNARIFHSSAERPVDRREWLVTSLKILGMSLLTGVISDLDPFPLTEWFPQFDLENDRPLEFGPTRISFRVRLDKKMLELAKKQDLVAVPIILVQEPDGDALYMQPNADRQAAFEVRRGGWIRVATFPDRPFRGMTRDGNPIRDVYIVITDRDSFSKFLLPAFHPSRSSSRARFKAMSDAQRALIQIDEGGRMGVIDRRAGLEELPPGFLAYQRQLVTKINSEGSFKVEVSSKGFIQRVTLPDGTTFYDETLAISALGTTETEFYKPVVLGRDSDSLLVLELATGTVIRLTPQSGVQGVDLLVPGEGVFTDPALKGQLIQEVEGLLALIGQGGGITSYSITSPGVPTRAGNMGQGAITFDLANDPQPVRVVVSDQGWVITRLPPTAAGLEEKSTLVEELGTAIGVLSKILSQEVLSRDGRRNARISLEGARESLQSKLRFLSTNVGKEDEAVARAGVDLMQAWKTINEHRHLYRNVLASSEMDRLLVFITADNWRQALQKLARSAKPTAIAAGLEEREGGHHKEKVGLLKRAIAAEFDNLGSGFLGDLGIVDGPLYLRFDSGKPAEHWVRMGKGNWILQVHRREEKGASLETPGMWLEIFPDSERGIPKVGRIWASHNEVAPLGLIDLAMDLTDALDAEQLKVIHQRAEAFVGNQAAEILEGLKQLQENPGLTEGIFLTGQTPGWERVYVQVGSELDRHTVSDEDGKIKVDFQEAAGLEEASLQLRSDKGALFNVYGAERIPIVYKTWKDYSPEEAKRRGLDRAMELSKEGLAVAQERLGGMVLPAVAFENVALRIQNAPQAVAYVIAQEEIPEERILANHVRQLVQHGEPEEVMTRLTPILKEMKRFQDALHDRGVVHLDTKLENYALDGEGRIWVMDYRLLTAKPTRWDIHTHQSIGFLTTLDGLLEKEGRTDVIRSPSYHIAREEVFGTDQELKDLANQLDGRRDPSTQILRPKDPIMVKPLFENEAQRAAFEAQAKRAVVKPDLPNAAGLEEVPPLVEGQIRELQGDYKEKGGWKLHLRVDPSNYEVVHGWLWRITENTDVGYKHRNVGDLVGDKDFTIYVGSKKAAEELASRISSELRTFLLEPGQETLRTDLKLAPKVWSRFDVRKKNRVRLRLGQYGGSGIPYLRADWHRKDRLQNAYGRTRSADQEAGDLKQLRAEEPAFSKRAFDHLKTEYGEYFTGGARTIAELGRAHPSAAGLEEKGTPEAGALAPIATEVRLAQNVDRIAQVLRAELKQPALFGIGPSVLKARGVEVTEFLDRLQERVPALTPFLVLVGEGAREKFEGHRGVLFAVNELEQAAASLTSWGAGKLELLANDEEVGTLNRALTMQNAAISVVGLRADNLGMILQRILATQAGMEATSTQGQVEALYGVSLNELANQLELLAGEGV